MNNNLEYVALLGGIITIIYFSLLVGFLNNPSYDSRLRTFLIWLSYFMILIFGYLLSVKIHKLITDGISKEWYNDTGKIGFYSSLLFLSFYTVKMLDRDKCAYDAGIENVPGFNTLKTIGIAGIVLGLGAAGFSGYLLTNKTDYKQKIKNITNEFL